MRFSSECESAALQSRETPVWTAACGAAPLFQCVLAQSLAMTLCGEPRADRAEQEFSLFLVLRIDQVVCGQRRCRRHLICTKYAMIIA